MIVLFIEATPNEGTEDNNQTQSATPGRPKVGKEARANQKAATIFNKPRPLLQHRYGPRSSYQDNCPLYEQGASIPQLTILTIWSILWQGSEH